MRFNVGSVGGVFKGILGGVLDALDVQDVLGQVGTAVTAAAAKPVLEGWFLKTAKDPAARKWWQNQIREVAETFDLEPPTLAEYDQRIARLQRERKALADGLTTEPATLADAAERFAAEAGDLLEKWKF